MIPICDRLIYVASLKCLEFKDLFSNENVLKRIFPMRQ